MFMVPTGIFLLWFTGFWFYGLIAGGVVLLHEWYERAWRYNVYTHQYVFHPVIAWNAETAFLFGGIALLILPNVGGFLLRPIIRALCRKEPSDKAAGTAFPAPRGTMQRVHRADGSEIQVEWNGPEDGPPVVLTHGWGANRTEWEYLRRDLSGQGYRLITWDLPGLGDSSPPRGNDYSLENFARDLDLVTQETCGNRPAVLAGHSIGGMTTLTFCRDFPAALGTRIAGLILVDTTYTDPVNTAKGASVFKPLEKPLLMPLQYLAIPLSPLLSVSNWMSYFNGTGHLGSLLSGFCGTQSWEELDFAARYSLSSPPGVIARGMLGMMRYDATDTLEKIPIPTLIVAGDRDTCCAPEASEYMAREIPHSELITLSPANHMGLIEHHQLFAEALAGFLSRCFAGERGGQPVQLQRVPASL